MAPAAVVIGVVTAAALANLAAKAGEPSHGAPAGITAPRGMVYIPGGRSIIGSDTGPAPEMPAFAVDVQPFFMDIHPVTVAQFRRFTRATRYVTQAEHFGSAGVFDVKTGSWSLTEQANWQHPRGPAAPAAAADHPVTQVSWNDAVTYCEWVDKRLPTEVEWEHAARGDRAGRYPWGDSLVVGGKHMANTWQGHFPDQNTVEDGYLYTSPVGTFGTTAWGLTDMGGNVWQWCQDWFRPYALRSAPYAPDAGSEKVIRGGSFLCDPKVCHGFRVSARGHSTPETGLMHIGFRCVKDLATNHDGRDS